MSEEEEVESSDDTPKDEPELTQRRKRKADSVDTSTHPAGHQPDKVIISEVEKRLRSLKFFADESKEKDLPQSDKDDNDE